MSTFQRKHATPEDFANLVKDYYTEKQHYNTLFNTTFNKHSVEMPHHPAEENATGSLTDQVAKDSKDSTASDHPLHDVDTGAKSSYKATVEDHKAAPGIVQTDNLGEPASKEDLKARAAELNK